MVTSKTFHTFATNSKLNWARELCKFNGYFAQEIF